jgi:MFS family permease
VVKKNGYYQSRKYNFKNIRLVSFDQSQKKKNNGLKMIDDSCRIYNDSISNDFFPEAPVTYSNDPPQIKVDSGGDASKTDDPESAIIQDHIKPIGEDNNKIPKHLRLAQILTLVSMAIFTGVVILGWSLSPIPVISTLFMLSAMLLITSLLILLPNFQRKKNKGLDEDKKSHLKRWAYISLLFSLAFPIIITPILLYYINGTIGILIVIAMITLIVSGIFFVYNSDKEIPRPPTLDPTPHDLSENEKNDELSFYLRFIGLAVTLSTVSFIMLLVFFGSTPALAQFNLAILLAVISLSLAVFGIYLCIRAINLHKEDENKRRSNVGIWQLVLLVIEACILTVYAISPFLSRL